MRLIGNARKLATLLLPAALGACSVYHYAGTGGFSDQALAAQAGGGIPVQVDGFVAGAKGPELAGAVVAAMPQDVGGTAFRYAPCEPNTECSGDHLVWTFGPPAARPSSVYPAAFHFDPGWIGSYRPSPNQVTAKLALFQNGTVVSSVSGQIDAPQGANDPAFRDLIDEMSRSVLEGPGWFD